ncbi:retropepsin-like aspartic protease [Aquimarina sp. 2201CG14-23]|uniref:retropepsin-like aspartic protease n=1 Tax=Aquimarina mycalae TaxID=3040073 RepID=UPI002477F26B|nr:aspartyl protease family protein [Aquimarina sp. 2201CG14-23]MDH7444596.1 aspartyl protease family protein [Aquimarina sp. 2201CG14-23]
MKGKVLVLFLLISIGFNAQEGFVIESGIKSKKIKFELVHDLIIVPIELNGVSLSFILDTGVSRTIVFDKSSKYQSVQYESSGVQFKGLGKGNSLAALKSDGNIFRIGNVQDKNHTVYHTPSERTSFSFRIGFPVHGILGYELFQKFVVEINYEKQFIILYDPRSYVDENTNGYMAELYFRKQKKPLVLAKYETETGLVEVNLLIDSGSSTSVWLFENKDVKVPDNSFKDLLGSGLNNNIYGRKSKIKKLYLGDLVVNDITTSFPDRNHISGVSSYDRHGSIGGGLLKRFNLVINYSRKKIIFKKNKYFSLPFNFNMSGISLGCSEMTKIIVKKNQRLKEREVKIKDAGAGNYNARTSDNKIVKDRYKYKYEVLRVRDKSPAKIAGLRTGDVVLKINRKDASKYTLSELNNMFSSEEGRKISILVSRSGVKMNFVIYLKSVI